MSLEITDNSVCDSITKLCIRMLKGNSDEMSTREVGPEDANYICVPIVVDCRQGMGLDLDVNTG